MAKRHQNNGIREPDAAANGTLPQRPCLLIVEPEDLLRWSLTTYLGRWFEVYPTESPVAANRYLDERFFEAVVTSDELPEEALMDIETHAHSRNVATKLVRTVTSLCASCQRMPQGCCIEKPFQLSKLATMLGVAATC